MMANRFPWKSRRMNENLLLASLLADLGQKIFPRELQRLRPKRMNAQQKREFKRHPEDSYLMLSGLGVEGLNETVLTIIREHHEYCDGSGFPKALTADRMLQLSKLVVLCGDLVRASSEFLLPPGEAAKMMFPDFTEKLFKEHPDVVAKYDADLIAALIKLLISVSKEGAA